MFLRNTSERYFWGMFLRSISQNYFWETFPVRGNAKSARMIGFCNVLRVLNWNGARKEIRKDSGSQHEFWERPTWAQRESRELSRAPREPFWFPSGAIPIRHSQDITKTNDSVTFCISPHRKCFSEVILINTYEKHSSELYLRSIP